jgi:endonuclease/exonuclease/phosphatase family metal-dependent hydrolase
VRILSWNIQCGKACDGKIDLNRTIEYILSRGDFDFICLQEIARNMNDYCAPGKTDQLAILQQAFPDFTPVWGSGFSWPGDTGGRSGRREFGNVSLVKSVPVDYKVHQLPKPAAAAKKQMQRVAVETVIDSKRGYLSLINTHLAFHDANENLLQLERLCALEKERLAQHESPKEVAGGCYQQDYLASARILCGDFNFGTHSPQYRYQLDAGWIDAWQHCHGSEIHAPTCGVHDSQQWPEGPHCRDYFWLSSELQSFESRFTVDTSTSLSDHQPIVLELDI